MESSLGVEKNALNKGTASSSGSSNATGVSMVVQVALVACAVLLVTLLGVTSAGVAGINSIDVCEVAPTQNVFLATTSVYGGATNCAPACNAVNITNLEERAVVNYALLHALFGPFRLVKDSTTAEMVLLSNNQGVISAAQPVTCNFTHSTQTVATVFIYSSGNYTRVVTTVPDELGNYAVCTTLATSSPAYAALERDEEYIGSVTLFGQAYITKYGPIHDASSGERIGALFVGVPAN
jgi:hypothetical protein